MFGWGPGNWWDGIGHVFYAISSFLVGAILFLIWLAIVILLVRFLLIGTRAAKAYLRSQGEHDGLLPARAAAPAATTVAPATAPTTTTTRTRPTKTPPAV